MISVKVFDYATNTFIFETLFCLEFLMLFFDNYSYFHFLYFFQALTRFNLNVAVILAFSYAAQKKDKHHKAGCQGRGKMPPLSEKDAV